MQLFVRDFSNSCLLLYYNYFGQNTLMHKLLNSRQFSFTFILVRRKTYNTNIGLSIVFARRLFVEAKLLYCTPELFNRVIFLCRQSMLRDVVHVNRARERQELCTLRTVCVLPLDNIKAIDCMLGLPNPFTITYEERRILTNLLYINILARKTRFTLT